MDKITLESTTKKNIKYIYHMADIHIRLHKRRYAEYKEVFNKLYDYLDNEPNKDKSLIVICGDILHSKNELNPESVTLIVDFLKRLGNMMDVILIMGNHDCNLSNKNNIDSLTPLVNEISSDHKLFYLRETGIYKYNNISFGVTSLLDEKLVSADMIKSKSNDNIKIGLYHGPVHGALTDVGYRMNRNEFLVDKFDGYDLVLLGDIHRFQYMNDKKTICYPSSLIQQSYGESVNNHGLVKWNLKDLSSEFVEIPNDYGFYTIKVNNEVFDLTDIKLSKKPRVRLDTQDLDNADYLSICKALKKKYDVQEIIQNRVLGKKKQKQINEINLITSNICDPSYQNNIIKKYLKENKKDDYDKSVISDLLKMNRDMNKKVDISLNRSGLKWRLMNLTFSNMFSYGQNNSISFEEKDGVIGILAPNHYGKSAIIDILLFCLFDKCSRGLRTDVLNIRKTFFKCKLKFKINDIIYYVAREAKELTRNKNIKIDVKFWKVDKNKKVINLNGKDRLETNKKITNLLGSYEDFIITSVSLQQGANFIHLPQCKKKEFLSKLLYLDCFETLCKEAKSMVKAENGVFQYLKNELLKDDIVDKQARLKLLQKKIPNLTKELNKLKTKLTISENELEKCTDILENDTSYNDLSGTILLNEQSKIYMDSLNKTIEHKKNKNLINSKVLKIYENMIGTIDENEITENHNKFYKEREYKLKKYQDEIENIYKKIVPEPNVNMTSENIDDTKKKLTKKIKQNKIDKNETEGKIVKLKKKIIVYDDNKINIIKKNYQNNEQKKEQKNKILHTIKRKEDDICHYDSSLEKYKKVEFDPNCKYCNKNLLVKNKLKYENEILSAKKELEVLNESYSNIIVDSKHEDKYNKMVSDLENNVSIKDSISDFEQILVQLNNKYVGLKNDARVLNEEMKNHKELKKVEKINNILNNEISSLKKQIDIIRNTDDSVYDMYQKIKGTVNILNYTSKEDTNYLENNQHKLGDLLVDINEYDEYTNKYNFEDIQKKNDILNVNIKKHEGRIYELKHNIDEMEIKIQGYKTEKGVLDHILKEYDYKLDSYKKKEGKIRMLEKYIKLTDKNGLPFYLLNNIIPLLEVKANEILSTMVDFTISIVLDKYNNITIYKTYDDKKHEISLCSGFEQFIVGLAIRISLTSLSNMPSPNFFCIDEGFGCFDQDNLGKINQIFLFLRQKFDFILLISHIQTLKAECDKVMSITKNDGFSKIKEA
jgi:DNA repair exonuclease SbcCD ATPase subunit/predicted MPP superfamily phosphohydrolase